MPLLLSLPALLPLVHACFSAWSQGRIPTGFIHYEAAYYMANARAHFAQGFQFTYGNPYAGYGTPAIYFQPHIFLLALLWRAGLDPGVAFNIFGLAALVFAATAAARLYQEVVGWETRAKKLGLVCFFWGGGVVSLTGLVSGLLKGADPIKAAVLFDPGHGWWMLNFGRNLVLPTEAYYHGVFLFTILMLVRRRFGPALALTALLSLSHPYTGLSLALVVAAYAALEVSLGSGAASWKLLAGAVAIGVLHVFYYLVFLNRFEDHRVVREQWLLSFPYACDAFFPALGLVGYLALVRLSSCRLKQIFASPRTRLFAVWFAVVFGLTQHQLVMKPMQPIHFAHGYDWAALFFLGAPALVKLLDRLLVIQQPMARAAALAVFLTVMLSDNLVWFGSFFDPAAPHHALSLSSEEKDVLNWLDRHAAPPAIVVSEDAYISYLTSTYTRVRSWQAHFLNTPHWAQRLQEVSEVFQAGKFIATPNPVYYIPLRVRNWTPPPGSREVYSNPGYIIWESNSTPSQNRNTVIRR